MVSCILLSAGLSERFSAPKALARLNGETVIGHILNMLVQSQVDEIIVVLGAWADQIKPCILKHKKVKFVHNKDYKLGQTSSFKAGLRAVAHDTKTVALLPVDYPLIRKESVDRLIQTCLEENPLILIPTYQGAKGHPPLFQMVLKDEFLALDNETGLNEIAHKHEKEIRLMALNDPGIVATFNTPEEFQSLKSLFT